MAYYLAKVEVRMENDRGRIQKIRELYCVEAESVTEAEAKVVQDFEGDNTEYQVKEVKEKSGSLSQLFEGIELTEKQIISTFERFKIEQIKSLGEQFDPNIHQAMFEVEKDDQEAGTVAEVVQEGYKIGDRLLRPALVGVVKKKVK